MKRHIRKTDRAVLAALFFGGSSLLFAQQTSSPAPAPSPPAHPVQAAAPATPPAPEQTVSLNFQNSPVAEILGLYETLTKKRLVRDAAVGQGAPLTIAVPGEVPRSEAIRLIEASLILNGYTFVEIGRAHV